MVFDAEEGVVADGAPLDADPKLAGVLVLAATGVVDPGQEEEDDGGLGAALPPTAPSLCRLCSTSSAFNSMSPLP